MFVQVITGRVKDRESLRKRMEIWEETLRPGASGVLGSTAGVAEDGTFVAVARFESAEAAKRNSDRPEQGEWWEETSQLIENPEFHDSTRVEVWGGGGSDDAGFVQVMRGRADADKLIESMRAMDDSDMDRSDVIGGVLAIHDDGTFTDTVYFTSEAEARKGEAKELPPKAKKAMENWQSLVKDLQFIDLKEPWLS